MTKQSYIIAAVVVVIIIIGAIYFFMMQPKDQGSNQPAMLSNNFTIQGMNVQVVAPGTGAEVKDGDKATVNYTGTLQNGTAFDSNTDPKFGHVQPFQFTVGAGQVIQGWDLGVAGMKVGEERRLTIPANLAYGSQSPSPTIPANSILIFDVTLLKIN
jgi:FKBP-type peptidyl-prolyl cis-trans isomerase